MPPEMLLKEAQTLTKSFAVSRIEIKSVDAEQRIVRGIASTPSADRDGDVVVPTGAKFTLPIPLLWQHRAAEPVGRVTKAKVTAKGIEFEAEIARIDEPGRLKDRVDEAWQSVKAGLVPGVSIGFRSTKHSFMESGGIEFQEWEWLELSLVTIPANSDAVISHIRSASLEARGALANEGGEKQTSKRAALGRISLKIEHEEPVMGKYGKQIEAAQAKRAKLVTEMDAIVSKSADEGLTLDAADKEKVAELRDQIKELDEHVETLKEMESLVGKSATPIDQTTAHKVETKAAVHEPGQKSAAPSRIEVKQQEKGTLAARFLMCLVNAKGNHSIAAELAREHYGSSNPELYGMLKALPILNTKAPAAAGTTTGTTWAEPIAQYTFLGNELIELLTPQTIMGQINSVMGGAGFRAIDFRVKMPELVTGADASWVGENKMKPVTSLGFNGKQVDYSKIAAIIAISEELARFSNPNAETLIRDELTRAIAARADRTFIDPAVAAVSGVSPASVLNGVTPVAASGTTMADFEADALALIGKFTAASIPTNGLVWIMDAHMALTLSFAKDALGNRAYPEISANGGRLLGFPVVVSDYVPTGTTGVEPDVTTTHRIALLKPSEIFVAQDPGVRIDTSTDTSLILDTDPENATSDPVSMFQVNGIAIRAERAINWAKRRAAAAQYIDGAQYTI